MTNSGVAWMALRIARFVLWAAFLVYSLRVLSNSAGFVDHFSRPLRSTEAWLYGLPVLAVTLGFLDLMMRERARIPRPNYFR